MRQEGRGFPACPSACSMKTTHHQAGRHPFNLGLQHNPYFRLTTTQLCYWFLGTAAPPVRRVVSLASVFLPLKSKQNGPTNGPTQPKQAPKCETHFPLSSCLLGNKKHFLFLWFSGKSPLNCSSLKFCSNHSDLRERVVCQVPLSALVGFLGWGVWGSGSKDVRVGPFVHFRPPAIPTP